MSPPRHQERDNRYDNPEINVKISGIGGLIRRSLNLNSVLILLLGAGGTWGVGNVYHRQRETTQAVTIRDEDRKKQFVDEQKTFEDSVSRIVRVEQQALVEAISLKMDSKIDPIQQSVYRLEAQSDEQHRRQDDLSTQLNALRMQIAAARQYQAPQRPASATE